MCHGTQTIERNIPAINGLTWSCNLGSAKLHSPGELRLIIGEHVSHNVTIIFCITGIVLGILFATLYRWHLGISLFPRSFHAFVSIATLIGCTEELVFRGFIQDHVKNINVPFSILFSSISHTGYKCCLFISPVATDTINVGYLAFWTIISGILSGTIKHISKSLLPTLLAHGLFDILVYAEYVRAPWWVW